MAKKYFSGFTLIELLVVISIIALLALLAINIFVGQIRKGNDAKRKADLDRIKVAAEEYEKDHNCYPPIDLVVCTNGGVGLKPYLNVIPCDPRTHVSYAYEPDPSGVCAGWFRAYVKLENIADKSIIQSIGPGGVYNYYVSSPNAPVLTSGQGGSPLPQSCGYDYWGCNSGVCISINWKPDCSGPVCQPGYDNPNCNGQCGTPSNPLNECIQ